jgi:xanthine dehydrogenase accessory factor
MNYSFPKLLETLLSGPENGLVLATIVEAEGSTPQVAGASAIFSEAKLEAGTVGGGVLEARVEAAAKDALRDGKARLMTIRLDADPSDMEGAICGGAVRVLVDPGVGRERAVLKQARDDLHGHSYGYLVAAIEPLDGDIVSVKRAWLPFSESRALKSDDIPPVPLGFRDNDGSKGAGLREEWGRYMFAEEVLPLPRLIIAGAGHVGRAVARLGSLLDFSVTVIDDRAEFANAENIPEADEIIVGEIGGSIAKLAEDSGSSDRYFVIVTRGHQKDAEALRAVIGKPAAYIGMIGSAAKIETMAVAFLKKGWATAAQWAEIHAPIGLKIGSKTVDEIAVSVAAELVLVRSRRKAEVPG